MTTWVSFKVSPVKADKNLLKRFQEAFAEVGATLPEEEETAFEMSTRRSIPRGEVSLVTLRFELPFPMSDSYGFTVESWLAVPGVIKNIVIAAPLDGFSRDFSEADLDHALRLQHVSERLHDQLDSEDTGAYVDHHDPEEAWFLFRGDEHRYMSNLVLEECDLDDHWGVPHFLRWTASERVPVTRDPGTQAFHLLSPASEQALLRNCLVCGARLPDSPSDGDFTRLSQDEALAYWRALWKLEDLREVEELYGPADFRLPGMELEPEEKVDDLAHDVKGQIVYWNLDPRVVVIFREYSNGRLAVNFAGKSL